MSAIEDTFYLLVFGKQPTRPGRKDLSESWIKLEVKTQKLIMTIFDSRFTSYWEELFCFIPHLLRQVFTQNLFIWKIWKLKVSTRIMLIHPCLHDSGQFLNINPEPQFLQAILGGPDSTLTVILTVITTIWCDSSTGLGRYQLARRFSRLHGSIPGSTRMFLDCFSTKTPKPQGEEFVNSFFIMYVLTVNQSSCNIFQIKKTLKKKKEKHTWINLPYWCLQTM